MQLKVSGAAPGHGWCTVSGSFDPLPWKSLSSDGEDDIGSEPRKDRMAGTCRSVRAPDKTGWPFAAPTILFTDGRGELGPAGGLQS